MKKNKTNKIILTIIIMVTMLFSAIGVVKAEDYDGRTMNWTAGSKHGTIIFKIDDTDLWGTCRYSGKDNTSTGRAKLEKVSNSSLWARAAYWMVYVKEWYDDNDTSQRVKITMQYIQGGNSRDNLRDNWPNAYNTAKDIVDNQVPSTPAPAGFTMYLCDNLNSGEQEFVAWEYHEEPPTFAKAYNSGSIGAGGTKVRVGQEITYKITWAHNEGTATITDTLGAGLEFSSVPSGCSTSGQVMTCTSTQESGTITYRAKVVNAAEAAGKVCNNATAKSGDTTKNLTDLCNPVPSKSYASNTANGKNHASVKVGDIITYSIKYANVTSSSAAVVVTDTISKGLEYVSGSGNVGNPTATPNSDGTTKLVWNRTLAAGAVEELTYKVRVVEAATYKVCNGAKVKIGNASEVTLSALCNPTPKKEYGGTSYADNKGWNHHEVLPPNSKTGRVGDDIKYKITLANVKTTTQTVVVTDVLSKGLTYNNDAQVTNGTITGTPTVQVNSDTKQTTITLTISIPAGQTAVLNYSAKVNEDAINIVKNSASATYQGDPTIKLTELPNPVPRKQYDVDTANGINGKIVQKDDVITYNIGYANGFTNNATVNLRDTLSKGLTYTPGTAKVCDHNKENCKSLEEAGMTEKVTVLTNGKTQILWTRTNMPSLGIEVIVYSVTVTGETIKVQNDFDIKTCNEILSPQTINIPDCQEQLNPSCAPQCDPTTDKNCKPATDSECTKTKQECSYTGLVCSNPWMDIEELKNPVPEKKYNKDTPSGFDQSAVAKRDRIRYEIRYTNVEEEPVTITIKDTISKGIEYVKGTSKINGERIADPVLSNNNKTMTWVRKDVGKDVEESLTYEVIVTGETREVINKACMTYGNNPDYERCLTRLKNPVPQKTYAKNTPAGANGAIVKKKDIIRYSIKYSNVKDQSSNVVIMDNLSRGLEYVKGSAKVNGKKLDPVSVTKDANGTMLVWMKEIAKGAKEELTYDVKVTGTKKLVENNASIQYDDDPTIKLDELRNPLIPGTQVVKVPNTASQLAIAGLVAGTALVGAGGYLIYRRYRNA